MSSARVLACKARAPAPATVTCIGRTKGVLVRSSNARAASYSSAPLSAVSLSTGSISASTPASRTPAMNAFKPSIHRGHAGDPTIRSLSTSSRRLAADNTQHDSPHEGGAHESHYDPPGGWLWGIRPGEKYEKEGWEEIWYYGFFGSLGVAAVAYAFKPDTSIQTWALEEARRRLEAEGILEDPDTKVEKDGGAA